MSKEELFFCPLGGQEKQGANMNLYAYAKRTIKNGSLLIWHFADDSIPGIDLIMQILF